MDENSMSRKYTNGFRMNWSVFEFNLDFMNEEPEVSETDPSSVQRQEVCRLRMSPQLAKLLSNTLNRELQAYESLNGNLPNMPAPESEKA